MRRDPVDLPASWSFTALAELGVWAGGGTPSKSNSSFWTDGTVPWVSPKDMKSLEIRGSEDYITEAAIAASATTKMPPGCVFVVTRSGILRHTLPVAVSYVWAATNQDLKVLAPHHGLDPRYLAYALKASEQSLLHACAKDGTTVQSIEFEALKRFVIPLAPSAEQTRIADALDELFSDLDAAVAALQRVRGKLKLYRAAVLKAAVEGQLTTEWREQHPDAEPASQLLQRILDERRRRWEQDQLAKYEAKGTVPPKNWKAKYSAPSRLDQPEQGALPAGWSRASLTQLSWTSGYGTSVKCASQSAGLGVLRIPNILGGRLDIENLKFAPPAYEERKEDLVDVGDLLVVRTNGSRSLIGRGAVVHQSPPQSLSFASYLIRLRIVQLPSLLRWLSALWQSAHVRTWVERHAATSAGQFNISLGILEQLAIPLPPEAEQQAIVEAVEDQLAVIDHLEADLDAKLATAQALRQAILRDAFAGKLVPQDPADEPASALLERIAAERRAAPPKRPAPRKAAAGEPPRGAKRPAIPFPKRAALRARR